MITALGEALALDERRHGVVRLLGPQQTQLHLGQIAAGAGGPFQIGGQFLGVGVGRLDAAGEGGDGGGELPGGLVEAPAGLVLELRRVTRLGPDLRQRLDALAPLGQAEVVNVKRVIRRVFRVYQRPELIGGGVVVLVGAVDERKGQAVAGGGGVFFVAEPGQELAEAAGGEGVVLGVERRFGAGEEHVGGPIGREGLGRGGGGPEEEDRGQGRGAAGESFGEQGGHPKDLPGGCHIRGRATRKDEPVGAISNRRKGRAEPDGANLAF